MKYITDNQKNETGQQYGCSLELDHDINQYYYAIMEWIELPNGGFWVYDSSKSFPHEAELEIKRLNKQ